MLHFVQDLSERARLIFLSHQEPPAEIYTAVQSTWVLPYLWLLLRLYDIVLLGAAGVPTFFIVNLIAFGSDITGAAEKGEIINLQIRLFPLTFFSAAPLATLAVDQLLRIIRTTVGFSRLSMVIILVFTIIIATGTSVTKSTSEPLMSNEFIFYTSSEYNAINWINNNIPLWESHYGHRAPLVWAGPDFRLGRTWLNYFWGENPYKVPIDSIVTDQTQYFINSPTINIANYRWMIPLPRENKIINTIYDAGDVEIRFRIEGVEFPTFP